MAFRMLMSGPLANIADTVALEDHLESMARGVLDTRALIYYLSLTVVGLMAAFRALESRRWS